MKFIKARHFRATGTRKIDLIVLHTVEAPEKDTNAEAVANYFATTDRTVSAHYCVDNNSEVQCVKEGDVAFAAPGANHNGVQIEMAGYAGQGREGWADDYSTQMLERAAKLAADVAKRYDIPTVFIDAAGLKAGKRGFTTHAEVSKAFRKSTHTDPGPDFPAKSFMARVRALVAPAPEKPAAPAPKPAAPKPAPKPAPTRLLRMGSRGADVAEVQRMIVESGIYLRLIDGHYGSKTEAAVKTFQKAHGLLADGIVGPKTLAALRAH